MRQAHNPCNDDSFICDVGLSSFLRCRQMETVSNAIARSRYMPMHFLVFLPIEHQFLVHQKSLTCIKYTFKRGKPIMGPYHNRLSTTFLVARELTLGFHKVPSCSRLTLPSSESAATSTACTSTLTPSLLILPCSYWRQYDIFRAFRTR